MLKSLTRVRLGALQSPHLAPSQNLNQLLREGAIIRPRDEMLMFAGGKHGSQQANSRGAATAPGWCLWAALAKVDCAEGQRDRGSSSKTDV